MPNLHNRDSVHTTIPVPATRPVITDLKPLGGFQVEIAFRDEPTPDSRAIPYSYNGCLLNYAVADTKLEDYAALATTKLMTKSPWTLGLTPEAEGGQSGKAGLPRSLRKRKLHRLMWSFGHSPKLQRKLRKA